MRSSRPRRALATTGSGRSAKVRPRTKVGTSANAAVLPRSGSAMALPVLLRITQHRDICPAPALSRTPCMLGYGRRGSKELCQLGRPSHLLAAASCASPWESWVARRLLFLLIRTVDWAETSRPHMARLEKEERDNGCTGQGH